MNTAIQTFLSPAGKDIRAMVIDGEPWFVGKDVATALGYIEVGRAIRQHCDDGGAKRTPLQTAGGLQEVRLINEGDVYSLIFGSRLPEAKAFKRWVTHEVLPAIRKDGGYMVATPEETPEQLMARALQVAQATLARKEKELEEARPKVTFANAVADSESTCLVGELAKLIKQNGVDIGQNRLFAWLRKNGYLMKNNVPTQRAMEQKLFHVLERTIMNPDGSSRIVRTPKVTGKGQLHFINLFVGKEGK